MSEKEWEREDPILSEHLYQADTTPDPDCPLNTGFTIFISIYIYIYITREWERMRERETCIKRTPLRGDLLSNATLLWSIADYRHNKYLYYQERNCHVCSRVKETQRSCSCVNRQLLPPEYWLSQKPRTWSRHAAQHVVFKDKRSPIFWTRIWNLSNCSTTLN